MTPPVPEQLASAPDYSATVKYSSQSKPIHAGSVKERLAAYRASGSPTQDARAANNESFLYTKDGDGGSGGDGMDTRIDKLSSDVEHLDKEVGRIRSLGMWVIGLIFVASGAAYHSINDKLYSLTGNVSEVKTDLGYIKTDIKDLKENAVRVNEKLDSLTTSVGKIAYTLEQQQSSRK